MPPNPREVDETARHLTAELRGLGRDIANSPDVVESYKSAKLAAQDAYSRIMRDWARATLRREL